MMFSSERENGEVAAVLNQEAPGSVFLQIHPEFRTDELEAFKTSYPQAVATEYGKEVINGQTQYEIETRVGELEKDFVYLPDGTLLQIEEDMPVKSLPEVVVESITNAYPNCEFEEADKITRGTTTEYEVIVEIAEDQEYELLLSSTG